MGHIIALGMASFKVCWVVIGIVTFLAVGFLEHIPVVFGKHGVEAK